MKLSPLKIENNLEIKFGQYQTYWIDNCTQ